MNARCPRCGANSSQGNNYAKMLELAEAGRLELLCPNCGDTWKPSPADQKLYVANLRKLIAPMPE